MAGLILREARASDGPELEALFDCTPMGSRIRLRVERGPDYFAGARVQAELPSVWAAFEPRGAAVGLFAAGQREVWLGGKRTAMRYLSDLRIRPDRQRGTLLARGFRMLGERVFVPGEWAQTLVLEDNVAALDALCSGRAGLPEYRPAGRYLSWLLPRQAIRADLGIRVRRAVSGDLAGMQTLLDGAVRRRSFSEALSLEGLGGGRWSGLGIGDFLVAFRDGRMIGMMGLWQQGDFQRLRIDGYARDVAWIRPFWNGWAALSGGVALPRAGDLLDIRKLTAMACEEDDPEILRAMLGLALSGDRAEGLLLVGCAAADPLAAAMAGLRGRLERGRHFLVGWEGSPPEWEEPFGFDVARI